MVLNAAGVTRRGDMTLVSSVKPIINPLLTAKMVPIWKRDRREDFRQVRQS